MLEQTLYEAYARIVEPIAHTAPTNVTLTVNQHNKLLDIAISICMEGCAVAKHSADKDNWEHRLHWCESRYF